jgi:hypothetical protein
MSEQSEKAKTEPTVLPWHREAAKEIDAKHGTPYCGYAAILAIIARHDEHAETLRLLEEAEECVPWGEMAQNSLRARIRAHIATHSKPAAHADGKKGTR